MDKRAHRIRTSDKEVVKTEPQPAKRIRRAMSTIENRRQVNTVPSKNISPTSTQANDCLAVTNAKLKEELIVLHDLSYRKDQKYIKMLQQYFKMKTLLEENNLEMQQEAAKLRERIKRMEKEKNAPLVDVGTVELDRKIEVADANVDLMRFDPVAEINDLLL